LSEVPACSNRVKNTTAPKISTMASIIRWRSTQVLQTKATIPTTTSNEMMIEIDRAAPTMSLCCTRSQIGATPARPAA
jgi:hypothetical protein